MVPRHAINAAIMQASISIAAAIRVERTGMRRRALAAATAAARRDGLDVAGVARWRRMCRPPASRRRRARRGSRSRSASRRRSGAEASRLAIPQWRQAFDQLVERRPGRVAILGDRRRSGGFRYGPVAPGFAGERGRPKFRLEGGDGRLAGLARPTTPTCGASDSAAWCQTLRQRTQRTERPAVPIAVALTWYEAAQLGQTMCIRES